MKQQIIPIKHGTPNSFNEAYANTETGQIEDGPWDAGPSDAFNTAGGRIISRPPTQTYEENYDKIFRKEEPDARID